MDMIFKLRYNQKKGNIKLENNAEIKEVMINEDFLYPNHESIALGFRNEDSSGIIELTPIEIDKIVNAMNRKKHLIKGVKVIR